MFTEDDLLSISALQHLEFCPRRCALVHLEGMWAENVQTAEGRVLHGRVHEAPSEMVGPVRVARGLRLASQRLGLFGVADVVEFHPAEATDPAGVALAGMAGRWTALPVEYKRGRRKPEMSYFVQLCAQALCLEEMLHTRIPAGALYHGQSRRRQAVTFDAALRERTEALAERLHALIAAGRTPAPVPGAKCRFCSLASHCLPKLPKSRSARGYLSHTIEELLRE
jgi:CRISPR-associated exonuclease Cas4